MSDVRTRARNLLRVLPLSDRQRQLYERGVDAMDEATLERTTNRLESALSRAPDALAVARDLVTQQQRQQRKRVVILVEDEEYRGVLVKMLGDKVDISTPDAPEKAIDMVWRTGSDVMICDFKMPRMNSLELIRRIRLVGAVALTVFVRTNNPEEDGQVAAVGATGYSASRAATDLTRAVTSAIAAAGATSP